MTDSQLELLRADLLRNLDEMLDLREWLIARALADFARLALRVREARLALRAGYKEHREHKGHNKYFAERRVAARARATKAGRKR